MADAVGSSPPLTAVETYSTGATRRWSGKCAPIWCIGPSPALAARKFRTPKPWAGWGKPSVAKCWCNLHRRVVELAVEKKVVQGRKMRDPGHGSWSLLVIGEVEALAKPVADTTVVETNIHYPTGSSLLGDGA